ncbi:MAG: zinc ABC transporter solute-binding protein [Veillonellaceae bacterium]|nr:zinc ABC transporter solute-binding protein [Veillonellaceae bacterium]
MRANKKWLIAGICAVALVSALVLTQRAPFSAGDRSRPTVVVTIAPQAAFVKEVAGDLVRTVTVLPPGANHETFSLPPQDMEKISAANLYLALGLPPERATILPKVSELNRKLKIIDVQKEVAKTYPPRYFAPDDQDPHIWLSPKRAIAMVQLTARELGSLDPDHRQTFEQNAKRFIGQIEAVDREIRTALKPMANRTVIVFHPAFGYFADEYNLTMVALEEEGKEADPRRMREMIDMARKKGIKIIFYQEDIDSRQSRTFAEELGGKAEKVSPMATDYVENLKRMARTFAAGLQ